MEIDRMRLEARGQEREREREHEAATLAADKECWERESARARARDSSCHATEMQTLMHETHALHASVENFEAQLADANTRIRALLEQGEQSCKQMVRLEKEVTAAQLAATQVRGCGLPATHCNTLQHTAAHYSTLQHTATHCNTLQRNGGAPRGGDHGRTALSQQGWNISRFSILYNTLQHTSTHCNTLQHAKSVTAEQLAAMQTSSACPVVPIYSLQRTAVHCNTLQYAATRFNTLQHTATYCNTVHCNIHCCNAGERRESLCISLLSATHCNTLQHTATHCNTLQHTATHCNMQSLSRQRRALRIHLYSLQHTATHGNTRQHTATHCNTLQHTCNTLQHTATHRKPLYHTATHTGRPRGTTPCRRHETKTSAWDRKKTIRHFTTLRPAPQRIGGVGGGRRQRGRSYIEDGHVIISV